MSGSWEIMPNVLCSFLHTDTVTAAWALGLRNLQIPSNSILPLAGMPYDHARNEAVKVLLHNKQLEYLFFLDSDVIPPNDAIIRLLRHNQYIISGMYCRRSPPAGVPVMIRNGQWVTQFERGSIVEVDMVGTGCILIHRSVFESLAPSRPEAGKHWFDWRVDMKGLGIYHDSRCTSEDFVFCQNARDHGYKILVDTSIECKHVGYSQVTYGKMDALESTPIT
jgi:hypothetical protein